MKMKQLGEIIVSKLLSKQTKEIYRQAARGIIRDGDKVLMIYCAFFNDYCSYTSFKNQIKGFINIKLSLMLVIFYNIWGQG